MTPFRASMQAKTITDDPGIADVLAVLIVESSEDLTNDVHLAAAIAKHGMVRIDP